MLDAKTLHDRLHAAMSEQQVRRTAKLAELNSKYIPMHRDGELRAGIDRLFENALEAPTDGSLHEGLIMLVTGNSGAGKSRSIGQALRRKIGQLGDGAEDLIVSVVAPSPCTSKQLALALLHCMGYPIVKDLRENVAWQRVRAQLFLRKPLVIWIDEMQHVVDGLQADAEVQKFLNTLKATLQLDQWPPVSVVMSGLPVLAEFARRDPQIDRRTREITFDAVHFPDDVDLVRRLVTNIVELGVSLRLAPDVATDEFIARLCHAANGALGLVIKLIRASAAATYAAERKQVAMSDFAAEYRHATGRRDLENPFVVSNWHEVRSWYVENQEDDDEPKRGRSAG